MGEGGLAGEGLLIDPPYLDTLVATCNDAAGFDVPMDGRSRDRPGREIGMRKSTKLAALIAVVGLVSAACTGGGNDNNNNTNGGSKTGGNLILGTLSNIDTLNPFRTFQQNSYSTFEYIYPQLVQLDIETLDFLPDFATKWEQSSDGLTWTFHTTPNAKWSDGQPLNADDVAFTFNTIIKFADGPAGVLAGGLANVTSVKATDDNTVVLTYSAPVANVLSNLQQLSILPEQVWGPFATGDGKLLHGFANEPSDGQPLVSGGPFELTKYVKNQVVIFERNPNFYGPAAALAGLGLQYFSNDDAMVQALRNGDIQAAIGVPVTAVQALNGDSALTVFTGPGISMRDLIINSSPEKTTNLELQDPTVREAMEYAIDRDAIVQTAWLGYGEAGSTIVPPATGNDWHDDSIQGLPFDIQKANDLLDQAGYAKGSDDVRVARPQLTSHPTSNPGRSREPDRSRTGRPPATSAHQNRHR